MPQCRAKASAGWRAREATATSRLRGELLIAGMSARLILAVESRPQFSASLLIYPLVLFSGRSAGLPVLVHHAADAILIQLLHREHGLRRDGREFRRLHVLLGLLGVLGAG